MAYIAVGAAGADYRSVNASMSRTSRTRDVPAVAFPGLLGQVRPQLDDWTSIRPGSDSEAARAVRDLLACTREKAESGEQLETVRALLRTLATEQRTTRDPVRASAIRGELDVNGRTERDRQRVFQRVSEQVHAVTIALADLVARHNAIVRALAVGSLTVPTRRSDAGGVIIGSTTSLSPDAAAQLAAESVGIVGARTPGDDHPRPHPGRPPARGPHGWHQSNPVGAAILAAERRQPAAPMNVDHEVA